MAKTITLIKECTFFFFLSIYSVNFSVLFGQKETQDRQDCASLHSCLLYLLNTSNKACVLLAQKLSEVLLSQALANNTQGDTENNQYEIMM